MRRWTQSSTRAKAIAAAVAAVLVAVVALVTAQLVLPGVAERRVREELQAIGPTSDVQVESFPAIELLFGRIDSVSAELGDSESTSAQVGDLLAKAEGIDELRVTASRIQVADLALGQTTLEKDAGGLQARTSVSERALNSFLPPGIAVTSISSRDGGLELVGSFDAFGISLSGPARVSPEQGAIVLVPQGIPLAGLARVTIFSDPRVIVTSLGAVQGDGQVELSARGRLADQ